MLYNKIVFVVVVAAFVENVVAPRPLRLTGAVLTVKQKKLLGLDLDEMLFFTCGLITKETVANDPTNYIQITDYTPEDGETKVYAKLRPGIIAFLKRMHDRYVLFAYTTSGEKYAKSAIDAINKLAKNGPADTVELIPEDRVFSRVYCDPEPVEQTQESGSSVQKQSPSPLKSIKIVVNPELYGLVVMLDDRVMAYDPLVTLLVLGEQDAGTIEVNQQKFVLEIREYGCRDIRLQSSGMEGLPDGAYEETELGRVEGILNAIAAFEGSVYAYTCAFDKNYFKIPAPAPVEAESPEQRKEREEIEAFQARKKAREAELAAAAANGENVYTGD